MADTAREGVDFSPAIEYVVTTDTKLLLAPVPSFIPDIIVRNISKLCDSNKIDPARYIALSTHGWRYQHRSNYIYMLNRVAMKTRYELQ